MSRPTKCRRVCRFPETLEFFTTGETLGEPVILTVDEYETIRLIDKEGLSQEDCGTQLGVGRTTVQKIYETARRKIAEALVLGRSLRIDGGDYYIGFTTLVKCNDYRYDTLFKMLSNVVCAYTLDVVYNGEGSFEGIAASMWSYDYLQKEFDEDPDKLTQHFAKSFDNKTGEFTSDVVLKYPVKYDEKGGRI